MKTVFLKTMAHEVSYITVLIIILVAVSLIVFPLFIAFLPILVLGGCSFIWKVDHIKSSKRNDQGASR